MNKDAETLADINNMSTDFIPLLSTNTLQRAGFNPTAEDAARAPTRQIFQATVQHSEKTETGYRLTLEQHGKTFQVDTPRHHAPGQTLTLQLDTTRDGEFRLTVLHESSSSSSVVQRALTQATATWLAQLNQAIQTPTGQTTTPFAQAALPQAIQALLVSRHLISPQHSEQPFIHRHTYTDTRVSSTNERPVPLNENSTNTLARTLTTLSNNADVPVPVRTVLEMFLQQRPQTLNADTVRLMVQQSGIFYEQQLLNVLQALPSNSMVKPNATQTFQALWQKTATLIQSVAPSVSEPVRTQHNAPATPAQGILDVLQRVKQQLNSSTTASDKNSETATAKAHAAETTHSTPETRLSRLSHDTKAVLAKAIHNWQHALNTTTSNTTLPILLHQLQTQIGQRPEGLLQLQTLLANIEIEQHQALQRDSDQLQWQTTLLWRDGELWREARLQHWPDEDAPTKNDPQKQVRWRLNLHFELDRLGPLDVELDLHLPRVSATFWSTNASSLSAIHNALQPLKKTLQDMGVDVQHLHVRHGQLPMQRQNRIEHHLVDIHT